MLINATPVKILVIWVIACSILLFDSYWYLLHKGIPNYILYLYPLFLLFLWVFRAQHINFQRQYFSISAILALSVIAVLALIGFLINLDYNSSIAFFYIIGFLFVMHVWVNDRTQKTLVINLMRACFFSSALCLSVSFVSLFFDLAFLTGTYGHSKRFGGILLHPNNLSFYASMFFYLPVAIKQLQGTGEDRSFYFRSMIALVIIISTASRSGLLVFLILFSHGIALRRQAFLSLFCVFILSILTISVLFPLLFNFEVDYIIERLSESVANAGDPERYDIWLRSSESLLSAGILQLLFGHGAGALNMDHGSSSHNTFLSFIYNQGLILTTLLLMFLTNVFFRKFWSSSIKVIFFSILVYAFTYDPFSSLTNMMLVWVLFSTCLIHYLQHANGTQRSQKIALI